MSETPDHQRKLLNKLDEIAQPILMDMQSIRPSLTNRFTQSDTCKMSVIIGTISFIISMILHSLINYVCQKYGRRYAKMRKFVVGSFGTHSRQILVVTEDEKQTLMLNLEIDLQQRILSSRTNNFLDRPLHIERNSTT